MIDTIVLSIPAHEIEIRNPDAFTPSAHGLIQPPYYTLGNKKYMKCIFTDQISNVDKYHPRTSLIKHVIRGGFSLTLQVELSLPKLLFGNNFNELEDADFESVITRLHYELQAAGINIQPDCIRTASISRIHYGKNILLHNATAALVLQILASLGISRRLDAANTDYRNSGHAVRFHTNDYELVFYDKVKDLEQAKISERRAIENQNIPQMGLLNDLRKDQIDVLRIECRLNSRKKIKQILHQCEFGDTNLTFCGLYSKAIAQRVIWNFWTRYVQPSLGTVCISQNSPDAIFTQLQLAGMKETEILKCIGLLCFIKQHGIRGLKQRLSRTSRTYQQLCNKLSQVHYNDNYIGSIFIDIERALQDFESIRPGNI